MSSISGGNVAGELGAGTGRLLGTLSKYRQNHGSKAAAMYMTFDTGDAYWIMFDGNSAASGNTIPFHANNTGNASADFELLDGGAYVRTELSTTGTMLARPWPIIVTQHVTISSEGTEFVVKNADMNHNAIAVYLIKGGPVVLTDLADATKTAELSTEGKYIVATYNSGTGSVGFSSEQTTSTVDAFYNGVVANAGNLCA
jgi:hypothetical protein